MKFNTFNRNSFNLRQLILWSIFFIGLIFASIITAALMGFAKLEMKTSLIISILLQDCLVFIMPALLTSSIISERPIAFIRLHKTPNLRHIAFVVLFYILSLPAMNYIVSLNEAITLPASLSGLENWMRDTEDAAKQVTDILIANDSIPSLISSILLIGVITGFSEEIFFRGTMQNIFESRPMNLHVSIWFTAIIFSVLHFQFFGFIPRLLLGAIFGYLMVWTGSLWTPIIAHTLNNSTVVISAYLISNNIISNNLDLIGIPPSGEFPKIAFISLILSCLLIKYREYFFIEKKKPE